MLIAAALVLIVTVDATGNAVLFLLSLHFLIVYFKNMMIKYLQDSSKVGYCLSRISAQSMECSDLQIPDA